MEKFGVPTAKPDPPCAGFEFGKDGSTEVRLAAAAPAGRSSGRGKPATFSSDVDILDFLRAGAMESASGQPGSYRVTLRFNGMGHYGLSVDYFEEKRWTAFAVFAGRQT